MSVSLPTSIGPQSRQSVRLERVPELDGLAPIDVAERIRPAGGMALLESGRPGRNARWTYLSADPRLVLNRPSDGPDPFAGARLTLARLADGPPQALASRGDVRPPGAAARAAGDEPSFLGGLVGHLSYDIGRRFERLPAIAVDDQPLPILRLQVHDWVLAHDRRDGHWWIGGRAMDGDVARLEDRLAAARELALRGRRPDATGDRPSGLRVLEFRSGLERPAYEAAVQAVRAAIERGELYQANVTRRLEASFEGDPWLVYRRLRTGDPALFAAFLPLEAGPVAGRAIVSASPEPFLSITARGLVASDPIKGTRPRGRDRAEDRRLARELLSSAKDRAENVMIVDVLRNDLGRVCIPGTVRVPRLCRLERTTAVQHLVSTVTGRLRPGLGPFDLLAAAFPGGSITGAPKIRAMQLLEGLEPVRRGPYTGAAGWIGADGAMQTSILIRTFVADGERLTLHVGGGITWRSDPGEEWQETVDKARGPLSAIGGHEVPS
ncbi:MAG TPA: anthranilate synthase component I family protein [Candidatus Eisenbacteria bacterium]|nr:anthranilate synthase component I family protein [Candidatus Eisenbacteria bacterium]